MRSRRLGGCAVIGVGLLVGDVTTVDAQLVQGRVRDALTGRALDGAVVSLVPEAGGVAIGAFTDSAGAYRVRSPAAGAYRLSVKRIGYQPHTSVPFDVPPTAVFAAPEAALAPRPQVIATMNVAGNKRCTVNPREGNSLLGLWDDVRAALEATVLTAEEQRFALSYATYARTLNPDLTETRRTGETHVARGSMAFTSIPADQLAREGYVFQSGDDVLYRGLDAHVLLSDSFLEKHCFRLVDRHRTDTALVGLSFEPVRRHDLIDVKGVLWLNRTTRELEAIDFNYVGLSSSLPVKNLGGRVEFEQLPSGRWMVDRWWIRMPRKALLAVRGMRRGRGGVVETLVGYQEVGGAVIDIMTGAAADTLLVPQPRIIGTIRDSVSGTPLAGATVSFGSPPRSTSTDTHGSFTLTRVPRGDVTVTASHPQLDSLGLAGWSWPVAGDTALERHVTLALPPVHTLLAKACAPTTFAVGDGVLHGRVDDGSTAIPAALVRATWAITTIGAAGAKRTEQSIEARAGSDGRFVLCGVPTESPIRVDASADGYWTRSQQVRMTDSQPWTRLEAHLAKRPEPQRSPAPR